MLRTFRFPGGYARVTLRYRRGTGAPLEGVLESNAAPREGRP